MYFFNPSFPIIFSNYFINADAKWLYNPFPEDYVPLVASLTDLTTKVCQNHLFACEKFTHKILSSPADYRTMIYQNVTLTYRMIKPRIRTTPSHEIKTKMNDWEILQRNSLFGTWGSAVCNLHQRT